MWHQIKASVIPCIQCSILQGPFSYNLLSVELVSTALKAGGLGGYSAYTFIVANAKSNKLLKREK